MANITITIVAEDGSDLRRQLLSLLGMYAADVGTAYAPAMPDKVVAAPGGPFTLREKTVGEATEKAVQRDEREEAPKQPRRAHRRTRPPVASPEPISEEGHDRIVEATLAAIEEAEEEVDVDARMERGDYDMTPAEEAEARDALRDLADDDIPSSTNALANEKLKTETIARLQDLFTEGKVKVIRHVLTKYGNGAKSFPEIAASQFPAIKAALQRGEDA